jgi:hypothetical protein
MAIQKVLYQLFLGVALFGAGIFFLQLPLQNGDVVIFHFNTFGVTIHHLINLAIIGGLVWLFLISRRNFLVAVDAKHSTVITRK